METPIGSIVPAQDGQNSSTAVSLPSDYTISLPLLTIFDSTTLRLPKGSTSNSHLGQQASSSSTSTSEDLESRLLSHSRIATQLLVNSIFSLPTNSSSSSSTIPSAASKTDPTSVLATLPPSDSLEHSLVPRFKPLPNPKGKPLTKWEAFAKKKGIAPKSKENRQKKVWDEERGEWVLKWGFGRKRDGIEANGMHGWLEEVKGDGGGGDGEETQGSRGKNSRKEIKERRDKNETQRVKNVMRAQGAKVNAAAADPKKDDLEKRIAQVGRSTTALGRYGEGGGEVGRVKGERRKFPANITKPSVAASSERDKNLSILQGLKSQPYIASSNNNKKRKAAPSAEGGEVNVRKAIKGLGPDGRGGGGQGVSSRGRGGGGGGRGGGGRGGGGRGRGRGGKK